MADKKTTKGKGGEPKSEAPDETENLYTLGEYIEGMAKAELIEAGAEVATSRLDKDTARLYGKAADFFD